MKKKKSFEATMLAREKDSKLDACYHIGGMLVKRKRRGGKERPSRQHFSLFAAVPHPLSSLCELPTEPERLYVSSAFVF